MEERTGENQYRGVLMKAAVVTDFTQPLGLQGSLNLGKLDQVNESIDDVLHGRTPARLVFEF
jgi:hypothetical protein